MLENFAALERHPGNVAAIDGNTVVLADGRRLDDIDVLLWGTGYSTDVPYIVRERQSIAASCVDRRYAAFPNLPTPSSIFPTSAVAKLNLNVLTSGFSA